MEKTLKKTLSRIIEKSKIKKTVLVTGGAGYLGSVLVRKLLNQNFRVIVLDALYFGDDSIKNLYGNHDFVFIKGDIENIGDLSKALAGADSVIHLAGIVGDPACSVDPVFTIQTNFFATQAIISLCKYYKIKRFVFASTCSVYGAGGKNILNEKSKTNPVSLYARSKLEAEEILLSENDLEVVILRMATLHGWSYRPRFDLVANLFAGKVSVNEKITVQGGNQRRPLLHLNDAANAFIKAVKAPANKVKGEIFNVGFTKENYTIIEIAELVKKINPDAKVEIDKTITDRRDYFVDFTKIEKALDLKLESDLRSSVKEMMEEVKKGKIDIRNTKYSNYLQFITSRKVTVV